VIVFLVDCGKTMMEDNAHNVRPFSGALECIATAVSDKVISSPQDEVAVVLYGTRMQKGDFPGVYVLR
jgi:hypothetical protein